MGMGKAIAARLVADGVAVAGLDRDEAALDETAASWATRSSRSPAMSATGRRTSVRPTPPRRAARSATG